MKSFDNTLHQMMWLYIRDNIREYIEKSENKVITLHEARISVSKLKLSFFKKKNIANLPLMYCYPCQYAYELTLEENPNALVEERCIRCPFLDAWESDKCYTGAPESDDKGLYYQLCVSLVDNRIDLAEYYCERIAMLKIRNEYLKERYYEEAKTEIESLIKTCEALSDKVSFLESKVDADTVYNDTELRNRVKSLENDLIASLSQISTRINDVEYEYQQLLDSQTALTNRTDTLKSYFTGGSVNSSIVMYSIPCSRNVSDTYDRSAIWCD